MFDQTTYAAYRAASGVAAKAQAVSTSLGSGTLYADLYNGETLAYSGSFAGPMTASDGYLSKAVRLTGSYSGTGTPDAGTWRVRIRNSDGSRWMEGTFGPGGRFTWSGASLKNGHPVKLGISVAPVVVGVLEAVIASTESGSDVADLRAYVDAIVGTLAVGESGSDTAALVGEAQLYAGAVPSPIQLPLEGTFDFDDYIVGGTPPYTVTVADGYSLPTGVSLDANVLTAGDGAVAELSPDIVWNVDDSGSDLGVYLGTLSHDGPATPEQIALYLPITGALPAWATATVRYSTDGAVWADAHPLYRIVPAYSSTPAAVSAAFAGVIVDLQPGTQYEVEVTVSDGVNSTVQTLLHTTRALPAAAGSATIAITAGSTAAQIQSAINGASPGDVVEFANATYSLSTPVQINVSGTEAQPIYIRGASRAGVTLSAASGEAFYLVGASHLVIENMTIQGSGSDSGTAASSVGIKSWNGAAADRITIRNVTMTGVDRAVTLPALAQQALVYDCAFTGNNLWNTTFLESNITWNDDGVMLAGSGNCAFNNDIAGFGDSFSVNDGATNVGCHFYRNRVSFTCDDGFEADYAVRNITFYDNRIQNSMTFVSCDPLYAGPLFVFRNVSINTGRAPYKLNDTQAGMFFYNNTVVRQLGYGSGDTWPWVQFNNGALRNWGYRNNILVCKGDAGGKLLAIEASGNDPIDFTHNAWYPDGAIWWSISGGSFASLATAKAGIGATAAVFGAATKRHENDLISEADPFATDVTLGATYDVQVTTEYEPALDAASTLKAAGVAIAGITDGYSGAAPDIGAVIAGRSAPVVGDRT